MEENDMEPSQVLAHLYLGSRAHARDKELLLRLQITHILNVTPPRTVDPVAGVPNFFEKDKKLFTYRRCPIYDNKAEDISGVLEGCIAFMDQAKFYGRILVHCNKGVSRSPSMVVAYLMKHQEMSFDQALQFVVVKRPMANPNASFRRQLVEYGQRLQRIKATARMKQAVGGPIGPALPPPKANQTCPRSIGPQLPPHFTQSKSTFPASQVDGDITTKQGQRQHAEPPGAPKPQEKSIGPQLPPHLSHRNFTSTIGETGDNTEVEQEDASLADEKTMNNNGPSKEGENIIGPSFPPSLKRIRSSSEHTDSSPQQQSKKKLAH